MIILYCHPLVQFEGGRFTSPPKEELDGVPLAPWEDLKDYIQHGFTATKACIEYGGRTFYGDVWMPGNGLDDYCYFIGDLNGHTESEDSDEASSIADGLLEKIQLYARSVWNSLRYSEALAPDERTHLPSEYIRPTFTFYRPLEIQPDSGHDVSLDDVLIRQRIVILGSAGAGKTSFARWLAIESSTRAAKNPESAKVPLYCRLASIHPEMSLRDALAGQADQAGASWLALSLFKLADLGRIQFILDGLDEVPDLARMRFIEELRDLSASFPLSAMVVTSRPASYSLISNEFSHFHLRPFGPTQIAEWTFRRLFDKPERSWKAFAACLFSSPDLLQLVSNPLLLNIATHVYTRQNTLPGSRALLVQTWLNALLDQWDHVRSVTRSSEYWASPRRRFTALCRSAFNTCETGTTAFDEIEYLHWEWSQVDSLHAKETLYSLYTHCGVVLQSSDRKWHFLHQVLLEHCAAAYLVEGSDDLVARFNTRITDPLWQNIWLQACALSQDATELICLVIEHQKIPSPVKAFLLLKSFTQPIRCDNSALDKCVELVDGILRSLCSGLEVDYSTPSSERVIWTARVSKPLFTDKDEWTHLSVLLEALYAARRSPIAENLFKSRRANDFINLMAEACNMDGEFSIERSDAHVATIVVSKPSAVEFWKDGGKEYSAPAITVHRNDGKKGDEERRGS